MAKPIPRIPYAEEQVLFEQNLDLYPAAADSTASKSWSAAENAKMDRTTSNMARSASRSSNYSPPSPSVPEAPKALRCDTTKSEATKLFTDLSISHCSSSHSPIAAPWNGDNDDYPAKRAGIAPSTDSPLPKFMFQRP